MISAKVWAYQGQRNLPQLMSFEGNERIEKQDDANLKTVIEWKFFRKKTKFEWMGGYNKARLNYYRASSEANFVNFDSRSNEQSWTNRIQVEWDPNEKVNLFWSLNTVYDKVSIFDKAQKIGYDKDQINFSLLNSAHFFVLPDWAVSLLIRSEWYNDRVIGFIPGLGTEYFFGKEKNGAVKLNFSRNYHQPDLNDRYWLPGGNPELLPEEGYMGDLNLIFHSNPERIVSVVSQVTCFASLIDNWIVWQPAANGATYWEASNLRKVFARGTEVQVSSTMKTTTGLLLNLKGNYSFVATSNQDAVSSVDLSRGKQLIYIPKHKANIFVQADYHKYYLKVNAPFIGKRYTTSNNYETDYEKILNPYWLLNLTCGKTFVRQNFKADVSVNMENLTNTEYMAVLWRPMPGRYYGLTVQLAFGK
jgi:iron complex outermembrane receptor protein